MSEQTPQRVVVVPGSAADPERTKCFRNIQVALAGSVMGAALAAQMDSLAVTIVVAARDKANAADMLESISRDLKKAVADNWDLVKSQIVQTDREGGHA